MCETPKFNENNKMVGRLELHKSTDGGYLLSY